MSDFRQKTKKSGKKPSRAEKERIAAANRARTGLTGAEKKRAKMLKEKDRRLLEGKRLEPEAAAGEHGADTREGEPGEPGHED